MGKLIHRNKVEKAAFEKWKMCIHSGLYIKLRLETIGKEKVLREYGYCNEEKEELELVGDCLYCPKQRTERRPPKIKKTAVHRKRISAAMKRGRDTKKERYDLIRDKQTRLKSGG